MKIGEVKNILKSGETLFMKDNDDKINTILNEKSKYNCRVLLQIQSAYYSTKDKDKNILSGEDTKYYPQVLLEQCRYAFFLIIKN